MGRGGRGRPWARQMGECCERPYQSNSVLFLAGQYDQRQWRRTGSDFVRRRGSPGSPAAWRPCGSCARRGASPESSGSCAPVSPWSRPSRRRGSRPLLRPSSFPAIQQDSTPQGPTSSTRASSTGSRCSAGCEPATPALGLRWLPARGVPTRPPNPGSTVLTDPRTAPTLPPLHPESREGFLPRAATEPTPKA